MGKILITGASGALGIEIAKILNNKGKDLKLLTNSEEGETKLKSFSNDIWKADACKKDNIRDICKGIDIVISSLGNSVSLFTSNETSFYKTDYKANKNILEDAKRNKVKRFLYISMKGAEEKRDSSIPKSHKLFEEALSNSGIDYSIFRPVGFFSGLHDLAIMAKRKIIPVIGDGSAKTNSIHQADVAEVVVEHLYDGPLTMEVGGPEIHTRLEMAEMIQESLGGKVTKIPEELANTSLVLSYFFNDFHDKLEYFKYITTHDMIAEKRGKRKFKDYLSNLHKKDLP